MWHRSPSKNDDGRMSDSVMNDDALSVCHLCGGAAGNNRRPHVQLHCHQGLCQACLPDLFSDQCTQPPFKCFHPDCNFPLIPDDLAPYTPFSGLAGLAAFRARFAGWHAARVTAPRGDSDGTRTSRDSDTSLPPEYASCPICAIPVKNKGGSLQSVHPRCPGAQGLDVHFCFTCGCLLKPTHRGFELQSPGTQHFSRVDGCRCGTEGDPSRQEAGLPEPGWTDAGVPPALQGLMEQQAALASARANACFPFVIATAILAGCAFGGTALRAKLRTPEAVSAAVAAAAARVGPVEPNVVGACFAVLWLAYILRQRSLLLRCYSLVVDTVLVVLRFLLGLPLSPFSAPWTVLSAADSLARSVETPWSTLRVASARLEGLRPWHWELRVPLLRHCLHLPVLGLLWLREVVSGLAEAGNPPTIG